MISVFAPGGNAIVAGRTVTHDAAVIKNASGKATDAMTDPTILASRNVCR